jgi:sterol desaturase/sphingolipid hydroxylase (fatty acid hydroxylase superfamily)
MDDKVIPVILVTVYAPTIVWSLGIRKKDTIAKYHIGSIKLLFSLNVLPLVSLVLINFAETSYINTVNIYIILMTALFFNLDGQTDLIDSFKQTQYYSDNKHNKLALDVFMRLLRRFIIFFGMSLLVAICYLLFITNYYQKILDYSLITFTIFNSGISILGTFFLGWILLAFNAQKK